MINREFFDRKAGGWRTEQARIQREIDTHGAANQSYIEEGIKLLELAQSARALFETQPPREKRRLLDLVLSNCSWKDGNLTVEYRQPFDALAVAVASEQRLMAAQGVNSSQNEIWLPGMGSNHDSRLQRPLSYH